MTQLEALTASEADIAGITATTLDYIEGWYEATPERTERCLHPSLAKRLIAPERGGSENHVHHMDAATLIGYVRDRAGSTPPVIQQKDITILGVYGDIASVRAEMNGWVDFLHLGKLDGRWQIVNVIWALKPREEQS